MVESLFLVGPGKLGLTQSLKTFLGLLKSGQLPKPALKLPQVSGGTKLLIATGTGAATTITTATILTGEGGLQTQENLLKLSENLTGGLENVTKFFDDNPIVLPLVIGLGVLLALK